MERVHETIFTSLTLNFPLSPLFLPNLLKEGLQSHRVTTDFRQHVSLALERQLSGQINSYASSLLNLPIATQSPSIPALSTLPSFPAPKSPTKQHPPLTASNSVANCNAASHLKTIVVREHRKLDRSVSEPVDKSQQTLRPAPPNSSRYKTELCRPFEESGTCKYGDKCQFAHGSNELRTLTRHPKYKTELCRTFHSTGFCPYGPRCHFIHNSEDSKKCLLDTLQTSNGPSLSPTSLSPPQLSPTEYDSGFNIGSAGELSPTSSSSGSGSPTGSLDVFSFMEDSQSFPMPQVPQTAPPTITSGGFFGPDYVPLKPLSALSSLVPQEEFQQGCTEDEVISSLDMLISEVNLDALNEINNNDFPSTMESSAAMDINRNIRLPIFSRLALGSSP